MSPFPNPAQTLAHFNFQDTPTETFVPSLEVTDPSLKTATRSATPATKLCPGVTLRVAVFCLGLAAFLAYLIPIIDYKVFNTFLGGTNLPPGAIATLLVLLLVVNPLLKLVSRAWAFTRNEVLTVYISCLFSCLVPGHGSENFIISNLISPFYYATNENRWLSMLTPYLKPWMTPALQSNGQVNRAVVDGFYLGGGPVPWEAWTLPLLFWGSFALVSYAMLGCLSVMLRAQWAENEALAFPLLKLPLEMTAGMDDHRGETPPFFRQQIMWFGFALSAVVQTINGLHLYYPDVPAIPMTLDMGTFFTEAPWNQIGWVNLSIYPIMIGLAYLLTTEVSFSLWWFFWFIKLQFIVAYYLGFMAGTMPDATAAYGDKLFTGYQVNGAFLAYVGIVLWIARFHLRHVVRRAFRLEKAGAGEKNEILSYPLAFWGFVLAFALMVGATCAAGVRIDIAFALWGMYLIFAIGLTRVAVEGGLLYVVHQAMPVGVVAKLLGSTDWLTTANGLVPVSFFQAGFANHMRAFLMPSFMQSFKLAHDEKIDGRRLGWLLIAVVLVSMGIGWPNIVRLTYQTGGLQMGHQWYMSIGSQMPVQFITAMNLNDTVPLAQKWGWLSVGGLLTYAMMLARSRLMWFPFHPIGYLMCLTYPIQMFWFSILLGWACKVLIGRFGGTDVVKRSTPFFIGMVFGDVAMMLFWLLIDGWQGRVAHQLMPG